jgi:hypothetical protein
MKTIVRLMALGLAGWTLYSIVFVWGSAEMCDHCTQPPPAAWWVYLARIGTWAAAVAALWHASGAPTRRRASVAAACLWHSQPPCSCCPSPRLRRSRSTPT